MKINKIIIGMEVHIELKSLSKMFCGCLADHFGKEPNTQTCPVCLGLPGALPVANESSIEKTILLGLSFGCKINENSNFDRKNYFYPDLPKGYQISQYQHPFAEKGKIFLENGKEVRITRVHLEEDTAKLIHQFGDQISNIKDQKFTLIDFNRSGVSLAEIVTEPDINSSDEAKEYLEKLHQLVRYLDVSDADMEKGSMRCEPNVNLEIEDEGKLFYTPIVELKNINSFRFVKKAIDYEVKIQFEDFSGTRIEKSKGNKKTKGWDEVKQVTVLQREKEEANDYRYFPEPDIPPFEWTDKDIKNYELRIKNYELPWDKKKRFMEKYGLSEYQAKILTEDKDKADYYESCVKIGDVREVGGVEIVNTIINKRAPENLKPVELIDWILSNKEVSNVSEEEIKNIIDKLLKEHPEVVESYKKGKIQALGMIVGLVKKETGKVVRIEKITGIIDLKY